jgi:hypothetical protein
MLDVLMWPWFERAKALTLLYKRCTSLDKERFPKLVSYKAFNIIFFRFINNLISYSIRNISIMIYIIQLLIS